MKRFTPAARGRSHGVGMEPPTRLDHAELTTNSPVTVPSRAWGWVSARPSEHLIVFRKGKLAEALGGQGGRFFKRPSDTYVLVPTTLKEVVFHANQVTTDFVDVRVRGMVVYRIVDPLRIYPLINFADRVAAEAKLAQMLSDMCRSAAKRLVANLGLDECIRRRREGIAAMLAEELSGLATTRWGVEVVTLDVQDVFVQDAELFAAMQLTFKAETNRAAQLARLDAERTIEARRLADARALEKDRAELALEKAQREATLELARIELSRRREEEQHALERLRAAQVKETAAHQQELDRAAALARCERIRIRAEARRLDHEEDTRALREQLAAESGAGRASLERLFLTQALPQVAQAVAKSLEHARLHVVQTGAGGAATGFLPMAVTQVLDLLQQRLDDRGPAGG